MIHSPVQWSAHRVHILLVAREVHWERVCLTLDLAPHECLTHRTAVTGEVVIAQVRSDRHRRLAARHRATRGRGRSVEPESGHQSNFGDLAPFS